MRRNGSGRSTRSSWACCREVTVNPLVVWSVAHAAIVRLLIDLAHNLDLNLKVTAEGIETAEQLHALRALGCSHGQGFHLGRPQPMDAGAAPGWLAPATAIMMAR